MAITLTQIRNKILTSIHGRRTGLNQNDFMAGPKDIVKPVSNATSDTTGTTLENHGYHTVATTTNDTWRLADPEAGVEVCIATVTTSTGTHAITPVAATIVSSNGVAGASINLAALGQSIKLVGISTAQWLVTDMRGAGTVTS